MLAASFAAFLFAQLFAHEMISQYQDKGGFVVGLVFSRLNKDKMESLFAHKG